MKAKKIRGKAKKILATSGQIPAIVPTKLPRRYGCGVCGSDWIDFFPGQVCPKCNGLNTIRRLKAGEILKPERGGIS